MKVLVVDDREENRLILQAKLAAHGYRTALASQGAEALARLRADRFDAVITDLLMPVMDGFQLTQAIKTAPELMDIPVIIYTATYTDPKDEALARNLGANAFLIKPAADETFFPVLAETIARAAKGELPSRPVSQDEVQQLKDYTARLIQKLEEKVEEVSILNASLERRIAEATRELTDTNAELEAYVNSVTHDLRTPLRTIEGFAAILLEPGGTTSEEERRRHLQRIVDTAARMQRLMHDLLNYSRLKHGEVSREPVDLSAVVADARERVAGELAASQGTIEISGELPRVFGVRAILTQALANLFSNALKFVSPGVRPRVDVSAQSSGKNVHLEVRDNGIGIAEHDRTRVFQVFERLNPAKHYPGTGIGLAMAQRAVEKMGGKLGFDSTPGRGSTFWIELPAAE